MVHMHFFSYLYVSTSKASFGMNYGMDQENMTCESFNFPFSLSFFISSQLIFFYLFIIFLVQVYFIVRLWVLNKTKYFYKLCMHMYLSDHLTEVELHLLSPLLHNKDLLTHIYTHHHYHNIICILLPINYP